MILLLGPRDLGHPGCGRSAETWRTPDVYDCDQDGVAGLVLTGGGGERIM